MSAWRGASTAVELSALALPALLTSSGSLDREVGFWPLNARQEQRDLAKISSIARRYCRIVALFTYWQGVWRT